MTALSRGRCRPSLGAAVVEGCRSVGGPSEPRGPDRRPDGEPDDERCDNDTDGGERVDSERRDRMPEASLDDCGDGIPRGRDGKSPCSAEPRERDDGRDDANSITGYAPKSCRFVQNSRVSSAIPSVMNSPEVKNWNTTNRALIPTDRAEMRARFERALRVVVRLRLRDGSGGLSCPDTA
jgi:hypothetical protein